MNVLIYDLEILRAIPDKSGKRAEGIEYCAGWHDHANMGITVLGVYDYIDERYHVFCGDNKEEFAQRLKGNPLCVGFNSIPFDNAVLSATAGWDAPKEERCYDLLRETWAASGLGPKFVYPTHMGYSLDAMCELNFALKKSGNGALAPVDWQLGNFGKVIDYCLNDVMLTKRLFDAVTRGDYIKNPKGGSDLTLRIPTMEAA